MHLPELKFEKRGSETVLLHNGKMVGLFMPSANRIQPWMASISAPVRARATQSFADEDDARVWLLGMYIVEAPLLTIE